MSLRPKVLRQPIRDLDELFDRSIVLVKEVLMDHGHRLRHLPRGKRNRIRHNIVKVFSQLRDRTAPKIQTLPRITTEIKATTHNVPLDWSHNVILRTNIVSDNSSFLNRPISPKALSPNPRNIHLNLIRSLLQIAP